MAEDEMEDLWGDLPSWGVLDDEENKPPDQDYYQSSKIGGGEDSNDPTETTAAGLAPRAQHCLVLIDCDNSSFAETLPDPNLPDDRISPMDWAMQVCERTVRKQVRNRMTTLRSAGQRDGFGILLYNTRYRPAVQDVVDDVAEEGGGGGKEPKTKNNDDEDEDDEYYNDSKPKCFTVHEFIPLEPPGVSTVHSIHQVLDDLVFGRRRDLEEEYADKKQRQRGNDDNGGEDNDDDNDDDGNNLLPFQEYCPLEQALKTAKTILEQAPCIRKPTKDHPVEDSKQVWILSGNVDPCAGRHESALTRVQRLVKEAVEESGWTLSFWPMLGNSAEGGGDGDDDDDPPFGYDSFYDHLPEIQTPARDLTRENILDMEELQECLLRHWKVPRKAFSIPLLLPDWRQQQRQQQQEAEEKAPSDQKQPPEEGQKVEPPTAIMCDCYRLVQPQTQPTPNVKIHQETGRVLTKMRQVVLPEGTGGAEVLSTTFVGGGAAATAANAKLEANNNQGHRLRYHVELCKERVPMHPKDKTDLIRSVNATPDYGSLIVLGFKPRNVAKFYQTLDTPYVLYPSDALVQGSTEAFAHLHAGMLRKNVIAVGEFKSPYKTSTSRLVHICPIPLPDDDDEQKEKGGEDDKEEGTEMKGDDEEEEEDDEGIPVPTGMAVYILPFEDEMRELHEDLTTQALQKQRRGAEDDDDNSSASSNGSGGNNDLLALPSDEAVQAATKLVRKLTLEDRALGYDFENANMAHFWTYMERIALQDSGAAADAKKSSYDTVVNEEELKERAGEQIRAFDESLPEDVQQQDKKRKTTTTTSKKRKVDLPADDSGVNWQEVYRDGTIQKCTVAKLKSKLKSVGEMTSGNKASLVIRVETILEQEFGGANHKIKQEAPLEDSD